MLPNPKETSVISLVETHLHGLTCSICNKKIDYHYHGSDGENRSIKAPIPPDSIIWKGIYWVEGHNAEPINDGRCCDNCNTNVVIPKRIALPNWSFSIAEQFGTASFVWTKDSDKATFWELLKIQRCWRQIVKDRMAHSGLS